jgi:ribosome-associated protein
LQSSIFNITGEYIELIKLLKAVGIAEHGAASKEMVSNGLVYVNGKQESRFRAKLRIGDIISVGQYKITIS